MSKDKLSKNLKIILSLLDINYQYLGDELGITRQAVSAIVNGGVRFTYMHYHAILHILETEYFSKLDTINDEDIKERYLMAIKLTYREETNECLDNPSNEYYHKSINYVKGE